MTLRTLIPWLAAGALAATGASAEMTAQDVIARYRAAAGLDQLRDVQTLVVRGNYGFNGIEGPFTLWRQRPGMYRFEATLEDRASVVAYDGETAWSTGRRGGYRALDQDATQTLIDDLSDFDSPLLDAEAKGHQVKLVGETDVEGTAAYHLRLKLASGKTQDWYLDKATFLPLRKVSVATHRRAGEYERVWYFMDYQDYGGLKLPSYSEREDRQHVRAYTIESVELGAKVDAASFRMPETAGGE